MTDDVRALEKILSLCETLRASWAGKVQSFAQETSERAQKVLKFAQLQVELAWLEDWHRRDIYDSQHGLGPPDTEGYKAERSRLEQELEKLDQ